MAHAREGTLYLVKSSAFDARIRRQFDATNVVMFDRFSRTQRLVVFLPGTGGTPSGNRDFLSAAVAVGYRAIALAYNNEPSMQQACFASRSLDCVAAARQRRAFGDTVTDVIDDAPWESVEVRLLGLLRKLESDHPAEDWGRYITSAAPDWSLIVISGQSQGGGLAAYIAKRRTVARVVILSGGWDGGLDGPLASWYSEPAATPTARWFAAFHAEETHATLIAQTYRLMRIPPAHIRVLRLPPLDGESAHSSVVHDVRYASIWRALLGRSP